MITTGLFPDSFKKPKSLKRVISPCYYTIDQFHCYPRFQKYLKEYLLIKCINTLILTVY